MSSIIIGKSLPPKVEGQLRCFLALKVHSLDWNLPQPPKDVQVVIHWWGDSGNGAVLRPKVESDPNYEASDKVSEVHHPIRCGPRQFNSYIQDMGLLHFDVVFGVSKTKFAKIDVKDIGNLSSSKPLSGTYPVICTVSPHKSKQVGTLAISIAFKTISDTYNVNSEIIPTTDKEFSDPSKKKKPGKKKSAKVPVKAKHVRYSSKSPERIIYENSLKSPKVDDISFVIGPGANRNTEDIEINKKVFEGDTSEHEVSNVVPSTKDSTSEVEATNEDQVMSADKISSSISQPKIETKMVEPQTFEGVMLKSSTGGSNILSLLLEKGEKLRHDMVKSQFETKVKESKFESPVKLQNNSLTEKLDDFVAKEKSKSSKKHIEDAAVDLLIGENQEDFEKVLKRFSVSSNDSSNEISELSDALHDSSLLSELFYNTKPANEKAEESSIIFTEDDTTLAESQQKVCKKNEGFEGINENEGEDGEDEETLSRLESTKIELNNSTDSEYNYKKSLPDTLSVDTLTLLGRVKAARVTLHDMSLKEPHVLGVVYFVEFSFPVMYFDKNASLATETVCNVSKSIESKDSIVFDRISVFPLCFNEDMVKFWWNKKIQFKCYLKFTRQQKQILFGEGIFDLRAILLSPSLSVETKIEIKNHENKHVSIGQVKLSIDFTFDLNGHVKSSASRSTVKNIQPTLPVKVQNQPEVPQPSVEFKNHPETPQKLIAQKPTVTFQEKRNKRILSMSSLLSINEGRGIYLSDSDSVSQATCHLYCVARVFWHKENSKTQICWNTNNPLFQFQEITHIELTDERIAKMKKNLMIIEVWNKSISTRKDKLIGMSKVSLNQYFLSYHQSSYAEKLLESQYPVISLDDWIPITDVISGKSRGHLKVVHALGTSDQIMRLLAMKGDQSFPTKQHHSNINLYKERFDKDGMDVGMPKVEHTIEITIEKVTNVFDRSETTEIWGESDCYVHYNFPVQTSDTNKSSECFRTKTTLCVPNLIFNHYTKHVFSLPSSVPLHTLLKNDKQEIEFELWKRQYYPNIREQPIGKCSLPIVKLSALITMHTEGGVSSQSFSLPLTSLDVSYEDVRSCGVMNILVTYKKATIHSHSNHQTSNTVGLSVSILRLCGLKQCAANALNKRIISVNPYVKFYLSSFKDSSTRQTNPCFDSMCPNYAYHVEFPLSIVRSQGEMKTLAEELEQGYLICEIYHHSNLSGNQDVLLATGNYPLQGLLSKNNGVRQWFSLNGVVDFRKRSSTSYNAGIELEMKFSNADDRRNIINISRSMGWVPQKDVALNSEAWLSPHQSSQLSMACQVDIAMDRVWIPGYILDEVFPGFEELNISNIFVYARYKFYDKGIYYSRGRIDVWIEFEKMGNFTVIMKLRKSDSKDDKIFSRLNLVVWGSIYL